MRYRNGSTRFALALLVAIVLPGPAPARAAAPITIEVDAREAPIKVFHSKLVYPVSPGPLTLYYPKWIPGEHGPTGPVTDLAGLRISAAGKPLAWRRDDEDMYAIHVEVPQGARTLEVSFDFLSPASPEGYSAGASATANLAVLSWNQLVLYPAGKTSDDWTFTARLRLPPGWKFGTALPVAQDRGEVVDFLPVTLTRLVDSPVLAGAYFRRIPLTPGAVPGHFIDMAADSREALEMPDDLVTGYQHLVAEAATLFGAEHFQRYHFLYTLSDNTAHFGLEHHESSDDRVWERTLIDTDMRRVSTGLLPHEYVHSWNGKYRRPAGLATPDYQQPIKGELLWVYEGLTQYLGFILQSRSGLTSGPDWRQGLAQTAAYLDQRPGRTWRPLRDTAIGAQLLYGSRPEWQEWRRGTDFYNESLLIWLEADVLIRSLTHGAKSLDDFCKAFHGGGSGVPKIVPYTFADVVAGLNGVAPYDWAAFLNERLDSTAPHAPLGGITNGGWKLAWVDTLPGYTKAGENARKNVDERFTVGLLLNEKGEITDIVQGMAAAKAGIGPGMKVLAVNGRTWDKKRLRTAIRETLTLNQPLEITVENGEFLKTVKLDYKGGGRYPVLERDASKPDVLSEIGKAHAK